MFQKLFQLPKLMKYATASKKWLDLLEFDIRNVSTENNQLSCTISFPEKLTGNDGIIHGGMICFVMDSVAGIHAQMFIDKNGTALTKNISVDFLIPVKPETVYSIISETIETGIKVVIMNSENTVVSKGLVEIVFKNT